MHGSEEHPSQAEEVALAYRAAMDGGSVSPVLAAVIDRLEMTWTSRQLQALAPMLPRLRDTNADGLDEDRVVMLGDFSVRELLPARLDPAGLPREARDLRNLERLESVDDLVRLAPKLDLIGAQACALRLGARNGLRQRLVHEFSVMGIGEQAAGNAADVAVGAAADAPGSVDAPFDADFDLGIHVVLYAASDAASAAVLRSASEVIVSATAAAVATVAAEVDPDAILSWNLHGVALSRLYDLVKTIWQPAASALAVDTEEAYLALVDRLVGAH